MKAIHIDCRESHKQAAKGIIKVLKAVEKYKTSDIVAIKALDVLEDASATSIEVSNCVFNVPLEQEK